MMRYCSCGQACWVRRRRGPEYVDVDGTLHMAPPMACVPGGGSSERVHPTAAEVYRLEALEVMGPHVD